MKPPLFKIAGFASQISDLKKQRAPRPLSTQRCWLCKTWFLHKSSLKKYCSLKCRADIMSIRADLRIGKPFFPEES